MFTVRATSQGDREAILGLVGSAFANNGRDGREEVDIVRKTWELMAATDGLDLVAVEGDTVIGYVLGARADLGGRDVVAVAPLAVAPSRQREGIGAALMNELIQRADASGWALVALLGAPAYYGRFGFQPSGPLKITYPLVGKDNPHFQVRRLSAYDPLFHRDLTYCWELE